MLTGTVLQGTRVPLPAWIAAVELFLSSDGPVTATQVSRATGLGREAARHVLARWQAAATVEPLCDVPGVRPQLFQG